jgi:ATP phosphoribosyltransferase
VILESSAYLIANEGSVEKATGLLRRLNGVVVAREYVIFDYDCPTSLVDQASLITPGIESPTVSPTKDPDWVAVRALVKREDTNTKMDELYDLGARAILVSAIHAARI